MIQRIFFFISLLFLLSLSACKEQVSEAAVPESRITRVVTAMPVIQDYDETFTVAGDIRPYLDVTVSAQLSEVVTRLEVDLGTRVKEGDLLIRLDDKLLQQQVDEGEANRIQKLANLTKTEQLYEKKAAPQQQYIAAKTNYDMAEARLEQVKTQLERTRILSPISGMVVEKHAERGELVVPGQPLLRIVNIDRLKVYANLSETDVPFISRGDKARIKIFTFPDHPVEGTVHFVSEVLDPDTRTLPVEILCTNPGNRFAAGMVADVTFVRRHLEQVPVVPADAVVTRKGVEGIWLVENGRAVFRQVRVGTPRDNSIPVLEGISGSDPIVVVGQRLLEEGESVQVSPAP